MGTLISMRLGLIRCFTKTQAGVLMWQINLNDALAGGLFLLAALVYLLTFLTRRKSRTAAPRMPEAALAADTLMHQAAERGTRLNFYLGNGFTGAYPDLAGASGLAMQGLAARRALFNDHAAQSLAGDAGLALISQMVTQGFYEQAIAPELFRPEMAGWSGPSPWAGIAGFLPELRNAKNEAIVLAGHTGPAALLALDLASQERVISISSSSSLSGQAAAFLAADMFSLGEDALQTTLAESAGAKAAVDAQDLLRMLIALGLLAAAVLKLTGVLP